LPRQLTLPVLATHTGSSACGETRMSVTLPPVSIFGQRLGSLAHVSLQARHPVWSYTYLAEGVSLETRQDRAFSSVHICYCDLIITISGSKVSSELGPGLDTATNQLFSNPNS